jgi:hypothetical protein
VRLPLEGQGSDQRPIIQPVTIRPSEAEVIERLVESPTPSPPRSETRLTIEDHGMHVDIGDVVVPKPREVFFNGIDSDVGNYFFEPLTIQQLAKIILGDDQSQASIDEVSSRYVSQGANILGVNLDKLN